VNVSYCVSLFFFFGSLNLIQAMAMSNHRWRWIQHHEVIGK